MILVSIRMHTKCFDFWKYFIWKCWCVWKIFWEMVCEQATTNVLPTQKVFFSFPPPLDNVILLFVSKKPYHWMWRDRRGSSYSHSVVPQNFPSHFSKYQPGPSGLLPFSFKSWITTFKENHSQGQNGQKHTEKSNFDF